MFSQEYIKDIEILIKGAKMKALLVVLLLVGSFGAAANQDCYQAALNNFSADSVAYRIYDEDISSAFEDNAEKASVRAVRKLEGNLGCADKSFEVAEVSCKEVMPGNALSKVCYVESQLGYFFISIDMMEGVNLVFNRWD